MCSVCGAGSFRASTWTSSTGSVWPALECTTCGAITRDMQFQSRDGRPETMMPPRSDANARIPKTPRLPRDAARPSDIASLLGARE